MLGGNSRYLSVTLGSALIMRTLIVNTKLGFHSGARATAPTQATLASRQEYGEQRIIHSQLFFGNFLLSRFLAELPDLRYPTLTEIFSAKIWKPGNHEKCILCWAFVRRRRWWCWDWDYRRRSIFFIYDGDLSCEYLGYVIIVIILCQTILQIARTVYLPRSPRPTKISKLSRRLNKH